MDAVAEFFANRVFGPERATLLAADLGDLAQQADGDQAARLDALRRSMDEVRQRQDRLVRTLESQDDPTGAVFARVRERMGELEAERRSKLEALVALEAAEVDHTPPVWLLVDELPLLDRDLLDAPHDKLRGLFEAFRLVVRYDKRHHHATVQVTIAGDTAEQVGAAPSCDNEQRPVSTTATGSHLRRTPNVSLCEPTDAGGGANDPARGPKRPPRITG